MLLVIVQQALWHWNVQIETPNLHSVVEFTTNDHRLRSYLSKTREWMNTASEFFIIWLVFIELKDCQRLFLTETAYSICTIVAVDGDIVNSDSRQWSHGLREGFCGRGQRALQRSLKRNPVSNKPTAVVDAASEICHCCRGSICPFSRTHWNRTMFSYYEISLWLLIFLDRRNPLVHDHVPVK